MKNKLVLLITKLIQKILKLMGRGGSLPGQIALKLSPNVLKSLEYPENVILVTGTNGKTTTTNMIYEVMQKKYDKCICNKRGDNLLYGVATLMLSNAKMNMKVDADCIVIEVDELNVPKVLSNLAVSDVVINNFFRDQLDRAGEMNTVVTKIENAISDYNGRLILNGDDPNVCRLANNTKAKVVYYGVEENDASFKTSKEANEGKFCPVCDSELNYEYYQYSHIGRFSCPNCDFGNHKISFLANNIDLNQKTFVVNDYLYHATQDALYAVYNCVALVSIATIYDIDKSVIDDVLKNFNLNDGRMETFNLGKCKCLLNLVKNPTGANEVMKYILRDEKDKDILIVLNDNAQDGIDVSWIWDAQFEMLIQDNTKNIICSGKRAYDMALRLKYSGYTNNLEVIEDKEAAVKRLKEISENAYVISTYTALQTMRAILRRNS